MTVVSSHEFNPPSRDADTPPGVEARVSKHPEVNIVKTDGGTSFYALSQSFAMVRHADRLDRTEAWETYADRERWPNDTPLTQEGHAHASHVGQQLKDTGKTFGLIISSPYLRCAQTASRIAQVLQLSVQFDLDLGEVFDTTSLVGNLQGPQHRSPADLEMQLKQDFSDVAWNRDGNNEISIEGKQQSPESLDAARMRFCVKVQQLLQGAASKLMSVVIVTHGDALGAVLGMMREDCKIKHVPYTSFAIASRQVKVLEKGSSILTHDEPVYEKPEEWTLEFSEGLKVEEVHPFSRKRARALKTCTLKKMRSIEDSIDTPYLMDDEDSGESAWGSEGSEPEKHFMSILSELGVNDVDSPKLARRASTSHHLREDREQRVVCSPHMQRNVEALEAQVSTVETRVSTHPDVEQVCEANTDNVFYALSQSCAVVRHGDRLDRTDDWKACADREAWPNDTPLTQEGHDHATQVGQMLKDTGKPFGLIVSSPYLRCAQTASRIAMVLNLPIQFDLDLGEVFDRTSMGGSVAGPQHRSPAELEAKLSEDFADVTWMRGSNDEIKIQGKQQKFPETLDAARMRFCVKVQQLLQRASSKLMSLVIVTHGDAVGAVIGMVREGWKVKRLPYTSFALATRQVKVMEKGSSGLMANGEVFEHAEEWELELSEGVQVEEVSPCSKKRAHAEHEYALRQVHALEDGEMLHQTSYFGHDDTTRDESEDAFGMGEDGDSEESEASQDHAVGRIMRRTTECRFMEILNNLGVKRVDAPRPARQASFSVHLTNEQDGRLEN